MVLSRARSKLLPLYQHAVRRSPALEYLFFEVTQRCNLACLHCGSDCAASSDHPDLPVEQAMRVARRVADAMDPSRITMVITGGEPLCHPDVFVLGAGLADLGFRWGMVTNGHALSEGNVARLVNGGISSVTVSLDGLRASHDWLRGVDGSFARATAGIQRLAAAGLPFMDVVTCVNPRNLDELPALQGLLADIGVRRWRLFSIFPKGRARHNRELIMDAGQFSRMLGFIAHQREAQADDDFELQFSCEGFLPAGLDARVRDEPYFCRAGVSIASVLCDGAISACPNISRTLVQGNIREDDFIEVWDRRFEPYRDRGWMRQGPCESCGEWKRCQGNSMHLWDAEQGCTGACTLDLVSKGAGAGPGAVRE